MSATETVPGQPQVSIVIPARNEEASLGSCLESLVAQTGVSFEIIVIDDHSADRTREIAQSFSAVRSAVRVIEAGPLPAGWTGKNNAVAAGAREARGEWLLFTDADTVHLPGSLAAALSEARENQADLLSYSPEQIAVTFWEMAVLPVVFAELARQYPPAKVSDPNSPEAAANGQYILITREAYDAVGGHAAIASEILEDVALARAVKASGRKIRFRYASTRVRTRMYRNFRQLREGWTKNLALLFPNPGELAIRLFGLFALITITGVVVFGALLSGHLPDVWPIWLSPNWSLKRGLGLSSGAAFTLLVWHVLSQVRKANFPWRASLPAFVGLPVVAYLLLRSKLAHGAGRVSWKGRTYASPEPSVKSITDDSHRIAGRLS
jgi:glycosyltransferase involved in cell wall biosynthesis